MRELDLVQDIYTLTDDDYVTPTKLHAVPVDIENDRGVMLQQGLPLETATVFIESANTLFNLKEFDYQQQLYLAMFIRYGNRTSACLASGTDPRTVTLWEEAPEFRNIVREINGCIADSLESEAYRRAMNGSDRLLEVTLKAAKPEKYAEKRMEHKKVDVEIRSWADLAKKVADEETAEAIKEEVS